ncbi:hypothetical protein RUND412_007620 [Rhizina undulata]
MNNLYVFSQAQNSSYHPVQQSGGALIYYLQRQSTPNEKLYAFPKGFRMIAGDKMPRSSLDLPAQQAIGFSCIDYNGGGGDFSGFPDKNCPDGLRAEIFFPSCWDGKNLDSPGHKFHVAYPSDVTNGECPPNHTVRFISIFYEIFWDVDPWKDEWHGNNQPFVLSNGDPTGYSLHGDFVNGWEVSVLQNAIDQCTNNSGVIEQCPYFNFFPDRVTNDCFTPPRINEQTTGWMSKLPGYNPIQPSPQRAVSQRNCNATTVIGQPKTYSIDVYSKGWECFDCVQDQLDSRTLLERTSLDDMTVPKCIDYCVGKGFTYAGLEYSNECYCGNSITSDHIQAVSKCSIPCAGESNQICGDAQRLSVYRKSTSQPSSVSAMTISSPTTFVTIATAAPTNIPGETLGWKSQGCWFDPVDPRELATLGYWGEEITTSGCIKYCDSIGFRYSGTENGGQCFCSNTLNGGRAAPNSECDMKCVGSSAEICGGSAR